MNETTRDIHRPAAKHQASLSLETAIVFPLVLIIVLMFSIAVQGEQDAMILSHALDQTAKEIALLLPVADLLERVADPEMLVKQWIPNDLLAHVALDGMTDIAATVLVSPFILSRVDTWATEIAEGRNRQKPMGERRLAVDVDNENKTVWLILSLKKDTPTGQYYDVIRSRIPIWNAGLFSSNEHSGEESYDGIWELSNFERGQKFRKLFGGHLPLFYPVIASWDGTEATSIKSMDWTAPSYSSPVHVEKRIDRLVSDLASFEGAGGEGPEPGSILYRRLILVIPKNEIPWKSQALLDRWVASAAQMGVVLDIRECGTSHVHDEP
ncbi:MAG: hypothetical protein GX991_02410 [Clostridiaceae bacterium]|nr:hypothetical protein [Clostridiaceae bacterium]